MPTASLSYLLRCSAHRSPKPGSDAPASQAQDGVQADGWDPDQSGLSCEPSGGHDLTLLGDLIDISGTAHRGDLVFCVTEGVANPTATLDTYAVTDQLADCFGNMPAPGEVTNGRPRAQPRTSGKARP